MQAGMSMITYYDLVVNGAFISLLLLLSQGMVKKYNEATALKEDLQKSLKKNKVSGNIH